MEDIDSLDANGIILAAIKPADKLIIMNESKRIYLKEDGNYELFKST